MLRTLSAACIAIACAGCTTYSTGFLVGRQSVDASKLVSVLYRPGTAFVDKQVRLQIPWIEIHGCGADGLRFEPKENELSVQWHVVTVPSVGTIAYFEEDAVKSILKSPDPADLILKSKASRECQLTLRTDVPSSVRKAVEASADGATSLLKALVAERLPSPTSHAWKDQYDYDPATRSMNLLPGMRLKVTHESPFTTDAGRETNEAHVGVLAAPAYLHLWAASSGDAGLGTWTPALSHLKFNAAESLGLRWNRPWFSATGLNELTQSPMFWRLYVPKKLQPPQLRVDCELKKDGEPEKDEHCKALPASNQAIGILNVTEMFPGGAIDYPGFVLLGAKTSEELATFNENVATPGKTLHQECRRVNEGSKGMCFVLRFRAIPVPEIPVVVDREQIWVEVGTTLRDILSIRAGHRLRNFTATLPPSASASASASGLARALQEQALVDALGRAVVTRPFGPDRARLGARSAADLQSVLDIPLQIGDEVTWIR